MLNQPRLVDFCDLLYQGKRDYRLLDLSMDSTNIDMSFYQYYNAVLRKK